MKATALLALMNIVFAKVASQFSLYDNVLDEQQYPENCVCVPYWQCKEDYSGLVDDGIDIIDIRITRQTQNAVLCTGYFDVCCQVECGRKYSGFTSRIFDKNMTSTRIFGENNEANFGEFPWMLGILQDNIFRCGGSLIHPQVAVTAAHCVISSEQYVVRAGEWNWETKSESLPYQDRLSVQVIIHPQFQPQTLRNDIALLILENPFKLSENIGIICIPPQNRLVVNKNCAVSGWGKNSYKSGRYQSILKKIILPIVPNYQCAQKLRNEALGALFRLHRSFICAGGGLKKDTCKGDGGGPLVCPISDKPGRYQQVGIVSWGLTCGLHHAPGVYVNVALFSDWIDKQMAYYNFDSSIYKTGV